jgi:hypothetical protein
VVGFDDSPRDYPRPDPATRARCRTLDRPLSVASTAYDRRVVAIRTPGDEQRLADRAPAAGSLGARAARHRLAAATGIVAGAVAL